MATTGEHRILTTRQVCVNTIESSDGDLECSSHNDIVFDTPNILIRNLGIDKHIRNLIFGDTNSDLPSAYQTNKVAANEIDTTDCGSLELDSLDALNLSSKYSYVINGTQKEHYVNIKVSGTINLLSANIYKGTELFYDYVHDLVNSSRSITLSTSVSPEDPEINRQTLVDRFDATNLGEYFTKTIVTNKVSTHNIYTTVSGSVIQEPSLVIESNSAVNLDALSVTINGVDLDTYIKAMLNETGLLAINIEPRSGLSIRFDYSNPGWLINSLYTDQFTYDITYHIYTSGESPENPDNTPVGEITNENINASTFPTTEDEDRLFDGLEPGISYDIYATVRNQTTNTVVPNILVATNVPTIPPIVIVRIEVVNETSVNIVYKQHAIQITDFTPAEVTFSLAAVQGGVDPQPINSHFVSHSVTAFPPQNIRNVYSTNDQTYNYNVSDFHDSPSFIPATDHLFYIKNSLDMVVSHTLEYTSWSAHFTTPSAPTSLQITYLSGVYTISWVVANKGNALNITYGIYFNSANYDSEESIEPINTRLEYTISTPLSTGLWIIRATNVYGNVSADSNIFEIKQITITKPTLSLAYNKRIKVNYVVNQSNGTYNVTSNGVSKYSGGGNGSSYILTTQIVPASYTISVEVIDALGITGTSLLSDPYTVYEPKISLGSPSFDSAPRYYKIVVSIDSSNFNSLKIGSVLASTLSNMSSISYGRDGTNNYFIKFQVSNSSSSLTIGASVTANDEFGFTSAAKSIASPNNFISISFAVVANTISNTNPTTLQHATSSLAYKWYKQGSSSILGTSRSYAVTSSGTYYCSAIQTNAQGFNRVFNSNTITMTISLPSITLTSPSFSINTGGSTYITPGYTRATGTVLSTNSYVVKLNNGTNVTTYTSIGTYYLYASFSNDYYGNQSIALGTFLVSSVPTPPTLSIVSTKTEQDTIYVSWTSGSDGTVSGTSSSFSLLVSTSSSMNPYQTIHLTGSSNSDFAVGAPSTIANANLQPNTKYYLQIDKKYNNPYGSLRTNVVSETTYFVFASAPTINETTTVSSEDLITVHWTGNSNGSSTSASYTISYKISSESSYIESADVLSASPHTITGLTSNTEYDVKVTKVPALGSPLHDTYRLSTMIDFTRWTNVEISIKVQTGSTPHFFGVLNNITDKSYFVENGIGGIVTRINDMTYVWTQVDSTTNICNYAYEVNLNSSLVLWMVNDIYNYYDASLFSSSDPNLRESWTAIKFGSEVPQFYMHYYVYNLKNFFEDSNNTNIVIYPDGTYANRLQLYTSTDSRATEGTIKANFWPILLNAINNNIQDKAYTIEDVKLSIRLGELAYDGQKYSLDSSSTGRMHLWFSSPDGTYILHSEHSYYGDLSKQFAKINKFNSVNLRNVDNGNIPRLLPYAHLPFMDKIKHSDILTKYAIDVYFNDFSHFT